MNTEILIKYIICVLGIVVTVYNYFLIRNKTKRSKTTNSLLLCCVIQFNVSLLLLLALTVRKYEFSIYFEHISLEVIILTLCIQIIVWLSWFKVFRTQFAHIFSDFLYATLNYISFFLYLSTAIITFISFFYEDYKILGIKSNYIIMVLVIWFSLIELVISISTFVLNYRKHKSWVKLREQQLQKLATINPLPLKMINDDVSVPINPITEDITKSNTKLEPVLEIEVEGDEKDDNQKDKEKNKEKDNEKNNEKDSEKESNKSIIVTVPIGQTISQTSTFNGKQEIQRMHRASQSKLNNDYSKPKGGSESIHSLTGSISKKSCLSYECIDKTILHYMHDKSVDFANSDPRATENNIKLISILHTSIYILHTIVSILIIIVLLFDWKYTLQLLLLYTQVEITIKLEDHFLLRQFMDLSLT